MESGSPKDSLFVEISIGTRWNCGGEKIQTLYVVEDILSHLWYNTVIIL
jgi:hypothetical protein